MGERLVLALLSGTFGLLVGLLAPAFFTPAQQVNQAEQNWLNPPPAPTPSATVGLGIPRVVTPQTAVPPTLTPAVHPTPAPPPRVPPPPAQSFTIKLRGGGEMTVVANDEDAARNNVREQGGEPAN